MKNLFQNIPGDLTEELFDTLVQSGSLQIERIVSCGHASPDKGWYDQQHDEFVLLLQGAARLEFEGGRQVAMAPGDWLRIPAHQKHRVAWTEPEVPTVWLAVHYRVTSPE